jgi:hypothetical protein
LFQVCFFTRRLQDDPRSLKISSPKWREPGARHVLEGFGTCSIPHRAARCTGPIASQGLA